MIKTGDPIRVQLGRGTGHGIAALMAMIGVFFAGVSALAADVKIEGLLDRRQVAVGQEFIFTVSLAASETVNLEEPTIPQLDGLRVTNSSTSNSTSSNMRAGPNGWQIETLQRYEFSFSMLAIRKGQLAIPPFSVNVDGKLLKTKPLVITVVDSAPGAPPSGQGLAQGQPINPQDLLDDPDALFRALLSRRLGQQPQHNDLPTNPNEVLFVQTEVDKKEVYEGEQVTANWYILVRGNLISLDRTKFPDLKGFWKEIIEEVPMLQFSQEVINGQVYRKALLASHALFPIKSGTSIIDEYKIKGKVQVQTSAFGLGQEYAFVRASDRVPIKVNPLPKDGQPADFTGAVGLFNVNAQFDNNVQTLNQPMTLKIRFEGTGNAKVIEMPNIEWPAGLEMLEMKSESRFFKNGQSFKEFEFILVPRQPGDVQVPKISVSLFNPEAKQYYTRTLENVVLKVIDNGSGIQAIPSARIADNKPAPPQEKVLPAFVTANEVSAAGGLLANGPLRLVVLVILYGICFLWLAVKAFAALSHREQKKDLIKLLARRMKKAEVAAAGGDFRQSGVEMINLFAEILGELSGQGGSHQEVEKMLDLGPPSLRRQFGTAIMDQLQNFQTLAFAPEDMLKASKNTQDLQKKVREGRNLMTSVIQSVR